MLVIVYRQRETWDYVSHYCKHYGNILDHIETVSQIVSKLNEIYLSNQTECQHIHNKCIDLIEEQKYMENEANRLRTIVLYFNDYNDMRAKLMNPNLIDVTSNDFNKMVIRIDECILFLTGNKEYKESDKYLQHYKQLRLKCILLIRNFVVNRLNKAKNTAKTNASVSGGNAQSQDNNNIKAVSKSELDILEFRAAATTLRPLIELIENQAQSTPELGGDKLYINHTVSCDYPCTKAIFFLWVLVTCLF